jgi:small subunit ribosomal protein S16
MLRIRLRRTGAKKQASYRVVVADQRAPRDGRFVEIIGYYNPRTDPITFRIDEERALYWLSQGAQPSEAVERLLKKGGTRDRLARLQAGEPLETLLAEAQEEAEEVKERVVEAAEAVEEAQPEAEEGAAAAEAPEEPELVDET